MTTSKSLPARPSLESLRKQAKKLARDIGAGRADAIARAREQLPNVDLPLTQRNAQLVIARQYGYAGWQDLTAEVSKRLGRGLEWAAAQARRAIHDNDVGLQPSIGGLHNAAIPPSMRRLDPFCEIDFAVGQRCSFTETGISVGITSLQVLDN